jgi:dynein heavy chain
VAENEEVRFYVHQIHTHIRANEEECNLFREPFIAHRDLWTVDIAASLSKFLASGPDYHEAKALAAAGADQIEPAAAAAADTARARLRREPPLHAFDEKIAYYKGLQDAVALMPVSATRGWLKVDARPAKQALSTWVTKWMFAYTQHLQDAVLGCLAELDDLMREVSSGLNAEVEGDNVAQLTTAMWHLQNMKQANDEVDELFEPLRGIVSLLRKYHILVADETVSKLEKAPFEWEDTKKLGFFAKEGLVPLQSKQAEKIKREAEEFTRKVDDFAAAFKKAAPLKWEVGSDKAYEQIDRMQLEICEIEEQAAELQERERLFDLTVHTWRELRQCRTELLQLKVVWDHVVLVEHVRNPLPAQAATPYYTPYYMPYYAPLLHPLTVALLTMAGARGPAQGALVQGGPRPVLQAEQGAAGAAQGARAHHPSGGRLGRLRAAEPADRRDARDAAARAGPARRRHARAALEEADAHLRAHLPQRREDVPQRSLRAAPAPLR